MTPKDRNQALLDYLLAVNNANDMAIALESLLTPVELTEIANRLQIFNRLKAGMPHRKIAEELGVGIATVSRGSRALNANNQIKADRKITYMNHQPKQS